MVFYNLHPNVSLAENSSLTYLNRILSSADQAENKSMARLSSGKILLADDPANYAIYEKLESDLRGLEKTVGNQSDMISYYRLQEGILGNCIEILQRIRELILQKSNGILNDSDREIIDSEIGQDYDQIVYTLKEAEFNRKKIFSDLLGQEIVVNLFKTPEHYRLDKVDLLLDYFISQRSLAGIRINNLNYEISGERIANENEQAVQSHGDTDIPGEMSVLKREHLLMLVNVLMLRQEKP